MFNIADGGAKVFELTNTKLAPSPVDRSHWKALVLQSATMVNAAVDASSDCVYLTHKPQTFLFHQSET